MRNILIIDDETNIRENIAEYLQSFNYKTYLAENGVEGIQQAIKIMPDLIVCDIDMPILNGHEVYKQIQNIPGLALTPFIFLTAKSSSQELREGMLLGADDYITKPFRLNDVLMSINKRLEKAEKVKSVSEQKLRALTENQLVGVFFYQHPGFIFANKKTQTILAYKQRELQSVQFENILTGGNKRENLEKISACLEGVLNSVVIEGFIITQTHKTLKATISLQYLKVSGVKSLGGMITVEESKDIESSENLLKALSGIIKSLDEDDKQELSEKVRILKESANSEIDLKVNKTDSRSSLSPREREVLKLICKGRTNVEIANELFLSNRTVEHHRARLMNKTNSKNTAQLVIFGVKVFGNEVL